MTDYEVWRVVLSAMQFVATLISPIIVVYLYRDRR